MGIIFLFKLHTEQGFHRLYKRSNYNNFSLSHHNSISIPVHMSRSGWKEYFYHVRTVSSISDIQIGWVQTPAAVCTPSISLCCDGPARLGAISPTGTGPREGGQGFGE